MTGKFAISRAGHDKGNVYVVVAADDKYVYLADGRLKTLAAPKKKNIRHIQIVNQTIADDLLVRIQNKEANINDAIKYAIKQSNLI
ncbi:MAG: KOW domain-containing RNA-binding protein [Lachnospiraceae bacterium]|nr:KOW domain-containing RNA-binding protein [Lachnospiraceae bacterium]